MLKRPPPTRQLSPTRQFSRFRLQGRLHAFNAVFHLIGQCRKKVHARFSFHLVNRQLVITQRMATRAVFKNKAVSLRILRRVDKYHFEESIRHRHTVSPDTFRRSRAVNRSRCNTHSPVAHGPLSRKFLQVVLVATVQVTVLRTDVRCVKRLLHSHLAPLHVGSRCHVSAVVARI